MESLKNTANRSLVPNFYCEQVTDIDIAKLKKIGITTLALDLDSTLTHHGKHDIDPNTVTFLRKSGMDIVIATNRLGGIDQSIIDALQPIYAQHATAQMRKPAPIYFTTISQQTNTPMNQICMVGDRLLTDIAGANKAGMCTIWVKNIGNDPWYTKLFAIRPLERLIVKVLS